jgi:carbamoyl-phosphate synthase large subunit
VIYDAIALGIPLSRIHEITKIDMWLKQYEELYTLEKEISNYRNFKRIVARSETKGFADRQIAHMMGCLESQCIRCEYNEYQSCIQIG